MTIRPLIEIAEFEKCVELQRECFGMTDAHLFPPRFYVVLNSIGGLVLGAFDGSRLVAFLNSMPGIRGGVLYWHSHVLAVAPEHWNRGIGYELKLAQRDQARQRGIQLIEWTFVPLESRNAYFNIEKLGAIVRRYYVNYYGAIGSALHAGLDSDRVVAEWRIDRPRAALSGEIRRVFIPADIQSLKQQNLESARDVQMRVRDQFLKHFQENYFVGEFERKDEWGAYLLVKGAPGVD